MKKLLEKLKLIESIDVEYFMSEGCAIYAAAFYKVNGGEIIIITNEGYGKEKWSKKYPFEFTHVIVKKDNKYHDVKGERPLSEIISDFSLNEHRLRNVSYDYLTNNLMGDADEFPLYGSKKDVEEVIGLLSDSKKLNENSTNFKSILKDEYEIAEYIEHYSSDDVDFDLVVDYFRGAKAVLKIVPIDFIKEGDSDHNIRSKRKETKYKKMPLETMPPLVVENGIIMDGNHRFRVAKELGATEIKIYDIVD